MGSNPRITPVDPHTLEPSSAVHEIGAAARAALQATGSGVVERARTSAAAMDTKTSASTPPSGRASANPPANPSANPFGAQVLDGLMAAGTTAIFDVRGPHAEQSARICLLNGDLLEVACAAPALSLGRRLVRSDILNDERYGYFLDLMLKAPSAKLGDLLLEAKAISKPQLHAAIAQQIMRKALHVLRWQHGQHIEVAASELQAGLAAPMFPMGGEAVRVTRLQLAYSIAKSEARLAIDGLLLTLGPQFVRMRINREGIARELDLNPALTMLVRRMDGEDTLETLAEIGGTPALPLLDVLHATGSIELSDERSSKLAPRNPDMLRAASGSFTQSDLHSSGLHEFLAATSDPEAVKHGAGAVDRSSPLVEVQGSPSSNPPSSPSTQPQVEGASHSLSQPPAGTATTPGGGVVAIPAEPPSTANLGKMRLRSVTVSVRKVPTEHDGSERSLRLLAEMHFLNGRTFAKVSQFARSVAAFESALSLLPRAFEYALYLGWARYRLDQADAAGHRERLRKVASDALILEPTLAFAHFALGELAYEDNQDEAAGEHFAEAIRLDPGFAEAQARVRAIEKKQRAREQAEAAAREQAEAEAAFQLAAAQAAKMAESLAPRTSSVRPDPRVELDSDSPAPASTTLADLPVASAATVEPAPAKAISSAPPSRLAQVVAAVVNFATPSKGTSTAALTADVAAAQASAPSSAAQQISGSQADAQPAPHAEPASAEPAQPLAPKAQFNPRIAAIALGLVALALVVYLATR